MVEVTIDPRLLAFYEEVEKIAKEHGAKVFTRIDIEDIAHAEPTTIGTLYIEINPLKVAEKVKEFRSAEEAREYARKLMNHEILHGTLGYKLYKFGLSYRKPLGIADIAMDLALAWEEVLIETVYPMKEFSLMAKIVEREIERLPRVVGELRTAGRKKVKNEIVLLNGATACYTYLRHAGYSVPPLLEQLRKICAEHHVECLAETAEEVVKRGYDVIAIGKDMKEKRIPEREALRRFVAVVNDIIACWSRCLRECLSSHKSGLVELLRRRIIA